jgi:lysyl-tRNA synthetase, class II
MPDFSNLDPFAARRAKLAALRERGINPFVTEVPQHQPVAEVRSQPEEAMVGVCGRIQSIRAQGKLCFIDMFDATGTIQTLHAEDANQQLFQNLELIDLGDIIWVTGTLFTTKRGELTVQVSDWMLLTKALRPLPDRWKGLQDVEQKQRQRYADLLVNPATKERFLKRSKLITALRSYLDARGYVEVETPVLEEIPGGADAQPFITHHHSLDVDRYLRISLELHLKRLVVGGFDRVYEVGRAFRNEGMSTQHLQEFTLFEFYTAYISAEQLMDMVQDLYQTLVQETLGTQQVQRGETLLDFSGQWPRYAFADLLRQYAGVDMDSLDDAALRALLQNYRADDTEQLGRGRLLDLLYKKTVRPHLKGPLFVTHIPLDLSPLAKQHPDDHSKAHRFLVLIDGAELGNGFSELNDSQDQRARFEQQEKLREAGDGEAHRLDEDFLRALEYGMPPTAGFGVGIDRFLTVLLDLDSIRETVFFPMMRPEHALAGESASE